MDKNSWFFWIDRLHITSSERYFVVGLVGLYLLLWLAEPLLSFRSSFDEDYYAPLMEVFAEHTADRYEARLTLLNQYYPGQTDTIAVLAEKLIPPDFALIVHEVLRRRQMQLVQAKHESNQESDDSDYGMEADFFSNYGNVIQADQAVQSYQSGQSAQLDQSTRSAQTAQLDQSTRSAQTVQLDQSTRSAQTVQANQPARSAKININTASVQELTRLPGIGPSIAERIVQHRQENGPFVKIEDIMNVRGIGRSRFEQISYMIEV